MLKKNVQVQKYQNQEEENLRMINICTLKLQNDPTSKKALLLRANIYLKLEQYSLAEDDLKKLVNDSLLNSTSYFLLGCIYKNQKNYNKSIEYLTKSIEIDPNNINSLFLRGAVFYLVGKYNEGLNDYSNALKLDSLIDSRKNIYKNISQIFQNENKEQNDFNENIKNDKFDSLNSEKNNSNIESTIDGSLYNSHTAIINRSNKFDLDYEINNYLQSKFVKDFNHERTKSLSVILTNLNKFDNIINNNKDNIKSDEKLIYNNEENSSSKDDKSEISSLLNKSDYIFSDSISKQPFENYNSNHIKKNKSNTKFNNSKQFTLNSSNFLSPIKNKETFNNSNNSELNSIYNFSSPNIIKNKDSNPIDINSDDCKLFTSYEGDLEFEINDNKTPIPDYQKTYTKKSKNNEFIDSNIATSYTSKKKN